MLLHGKDLKSCKSRIQGFNGITTERVDLLVVLGEGDRKRVQIVTFVVLDIFTTYNAFLTQLDLAIFQTVIAPWCLMMKFPTDNGVGVVQGDQGLECECYVAKLKEAKRHEKEKGMEKTLCIKSLDA